MIEPRNIGPAAPTIFVNKISGIFRLNPTITKVTFALSRGPAVAVEASSSLWETAELDDAHAGWAFDEIRCGIIGMDEGLRIIRAN
jgi:hypothetical protein